MGARWKHHKGTTEAPWKSVKVRGRIPMVPPWCFHGLPWCFDEGACALMVLPWCIHGLPWCLHGSSKMLSRCFHCAFMGSHVVLSWFLQGAFKVERALPWGVHRAFMLDSWVPQCFHGGACVLVAVPWRFHDVSWVPSMVVSLAPMVLSC